MRILKLDATGHTVTTLDLSAESAVAEVEHIIALARSEGRLVVADDTLLQPGESLPITTETLTLLAPLVGG